MHEVGFKTPARTFILATQVTLLLQRVQTALLAKFLQNAISTIFLGNLWDNFNKISSKIYYCQNTPSLKLKLCVGG